MFDKTMHQHVRDKVAKAAIIQVYPLVTCSICYSYNY